MVDIAAVHSAFMAYDYPGWVVAERDQSPVPATSMLLNAWFVQNRLITPAVMEA